MSERDVVIAAGIFLLCMVLGMAVGLAAMAAAETAR